MREQGAQLMGTESVALLREEYALVKQAVTDQVNSVGAIGRPSSRTGDNYYEVLLEKRDRFIATRIADTLQQTETGLLFIGMLHSVETYLPDSIVVHYPFGKPSRESLRVRRLNVQR
jgi:pheromone shutdown protein TraB